MRDLRERSGGLTKTAEAGHLSIITKRDGPVMVGVPFTGYLPEQVVGINFALHLFKNRIVTLTKAARIADRPLAEFIQILGVMGVDVVD